MWLPYVYLSRVSANRKQPGIMGKNYGFKNRNASILPLPLSSYVSLFKVLNLCKSGFSFSVLKQENCLTGFREESYKIMYAKMLTMGCGKYLFMVNLIPQ